MLGRHVAGATQCRSESAERDDTLGCHSAGDSSLVSKPMRPFSGNATAANMPVAPTSAAVWAIENSPSGGGANSLNGVTCTSASDCWAVGSNGSPLTEHWNGTSWSIVPAAYTTGYSFGFNGVTCSSASDCWAVGVYGVPSSDQFTLIEHWDGT